ncbi:MAG TPA: cytochrome c3 family protein [Gemmatimonadota bacterium]|nr:cytochrome c3 family protein [Gemmatimonadota bacterium]
MPIHASGWRRSILPILLVFGASACERTGWKAQIAREDTPVQPIRFLHSVHVGIDSIPCAYCHYSANVSEEAGIPPVGTCMGCHRFVAGTTDEFRTEIQKLLGFAADSTAVPWVRVHSVPAFVQFNHKPHVRAGVTCAECHGNVGAMDEVSRVAPLTMGWCVTCHRDRGASDDCSVCHY